MNEPVPDSPLTKALVSEDYCPRCLGELDTGWECNDCGYDAMPHVEVGSDEE